MTYITAVVSAGHDEYGLSLPADQWVPIWGGTDDLSSWMNNIDRMLDFETDRPAFDAKWTEVTGLPASAIPADADLSWENIYRLDAPIAAIQAAFETLLADVSTTPSGDDDTFDYWPSGVRLAFSIARLLGPEQVARVDGAARSVIKNSPFSGELFDKVGLTSQPQLHGTWCEHGAEGTDNAGDVFGIEENVESHLLAAGFTPEQLSAAYGHDLYCINALRLPTVRVVGHSPHADPEIHIQAPPVKRNRGRQNLALPYGLTSADLVLDPTTERRMEEGTLDARFVMRFLAEEATADELPLIVAAAAALLDTLQPVTGFPAVIADNDLLVAALDTAIVWARG